MTRTEELFLKWMKTAENDIRYAKGNFKMGYYSQTCFLCQQSAEKSLLHIVSKKVAKKKI